MPRGWSVWQAWVDAVRDRGDDVSPERSDWNTLSEDDRGMAERIEAAVMNDAALGSRLIRMGARSLRQLGTRTSNGALVEADWGEPDEWGVYQPRFTARDDGWTRELQRHSGEETERLRRENRRLVDAPAMMRDRLHRIAEMSPDSSEPMQRFAERMSEAAGQAYYEDDDLSYLISEYNSRLRNEGAQRERRSPVCFICGRCRQGEHEESGCSCPGPCSEPSWAIWLLHVVNNPDVYRQISDEMYNQSQARAQRPDGPPGGRIALGA